MNNSKYISNLMVIHRSMSHLITNDTMQKFDETITAAIIALQRCDDIFDEEEAEDELPELHQRSTETES